MGKVKDRLEISSHVLKKNRLIKGINKKVKVIPLKGKNINLNKVSIDSWSLEGLEIEKLDFVDIKHLNTINKLKKHKAILKCIGVEDVSKTGDISLTGKNLSKFGVFYPNLINNPINKNKANPNINLAFKKNKHAGLNAKLISLKTLKARKISSSAKLNILPSVYSGYTGSRSAFPIGVSYIVANTLQLNNYTSIIIEQGVTNLIIIANQIVTNGTTINLTWNKHILQRPSSLNQANSGGLNQSGNSGSIGSDGEEGVFAPKVEIWSINPIRDTSGNIVNTPLVVNLHGQDGGQGGSGQNGGNGGIGLNGADCVPAKFECKAGPRSGKQGGRGGNGGVGGVGGIGGNGGSLEIYAPTTHLSNYSSIMLLNSAGKGGSGGSRGLGGSGGSGGKRGEIRGFCANSWFDWSNRKDGVKGNKGSNGSIGIIGADGVDGIQIQLNPITTAMYNQVLNSPGIISLSSNTNKVGSVINISGVNLSQTDQVQFDNLIIPSILNNGNPYQFHEISVPDLEGGWKDVFIKNTVTNNQSNLLRFCIKPNITGFSVARIKPGEQLVIHGDGFSVLCKVYINGEQVQNYNFINKKTIEITAYRPNAITRNPEGETVNLYVSDNYNNKSNTRSFIFDTYQVVYAGDSIVANQGLALVNGYTGLLTQHLISVNSEMGVYSKHLAHSGATIEGGNNDFSLDKEIPRSEPSIKAQINELISPDPLINENVDLIVTDGSMNDIGIFSIVTPEILPIPHQSRLDKISDLALQFSYHSLKSMLLTIGNNFPNAKVIVTGYYQIISNQSSHSLIDVTNYLSIYLTGGLGNILTNSAFNSVVAQCKHANIEINRQMQNAVNDVNSDLGTSNFIFVDPQFDESNALFAPNTYLWGFDILGEVEDPLKLDRLSFCNNDGFCERASTGHPNHQGTQQYLNRIISVL